MPMIAGCYSQVLGFDDIFEFPQHGSTWQLDCSGLFILPSFATRCSDKQTAEKLPLILLLHCPSVNRRMIA